MRWPELEKLFLIRYSICVANDVYSFIFGVFPHNCVNSLVVYQRVVSLAMSSLELEGCG